jgi:hypothetical protein
MLIKLTQANESGEDVGVIFINSDQIVSISTVQNVTEIHTADGKPQWVKETPEQIAALLKR